MRKTEEVSGIQIFPCLSEVISETVFSIFVPRLLVSSKDLKDCAIDYNQKFDHIRILKELDNLNFIYNNNAHPILNYYANEFNINVGTFIRNEVTSSKLGETTKKVKELILFKNSLLNKSVATNQSSYRPIELVA